MDEMRLDGLKELQSTLKDLPDRIGNNVMRSALRAGAQVIRKEAQQRVPVLQDEVPHRKRATVKNAIRIRRSRRDKVGLFVGVKPLKGAQIAAFKKGGGGKGSNNPNDPFYWTFLEFGTAKMAARPFLRPAFETKKGEALARILAKARERAVKESEKLAREKGMPR